MSLRPSLAAAAAPSSSIVPFVAISVICGLLVGLGVLVLLSRGDDVSRRVGGFVGPPAPPAGPPQDQVAELNLSPEQLLIITIIATIGVGWVLETGTHSFIGMLLAVSVPFCAFLFVRMMAAKHRRRFSEQLPDNLQVIASAMRAGQTFIGAMGAVIEDAPEPSKRERRLPARSDRRRLAT
jgi:hypothetical protein